MSDDGNAVVLKDVKKDYRVKGKGEKVAALRGVNMTIKRGAMVAIKGPSGSGKTTLLQIIGALDIPTSGEVSVEGKDLSHMKERDLTEYRAKTIGFVFQTYNLIPNLTALENVELPMEALRVPKKKRRQRASELLDAVDMAKRANYKPLKLSGGEAQRVAIARALSNEPSIILADEPTGNLDSKTGAAIISLMDKLRTEMGTTIVLVTHSDSAAEMCTTTFTIKDGMITGEEATMQKKESEARRKSLRIDLSASEKIVNKLADAGYDSIEAIGSASVEELTRILGDANKAKRILKKATVLKELKEEKVE
jgi:putative ABC transport system ATP-binding protein